MTTLSEEVAEVVRLRETYETEGPKCPCCGRQYTAEEPGYYDEMRYIEETCDGCGVTFDVSVCTETTWTCTERARLTASAGGE